MSLPPSSSGSGYRSLSRGSFLLPACSSLNLGVLRVVVCSVLPLIASGNFLRKLAQLPPELRSVPPGWQGFAPHLFPSPGAAWALGAIFHMCCLLAAIGIATKPALQCAVLTGLWALCLPLSFGKVNHYHFLYWILVLLAVSPSDHALTLGRAVKAAMKRSTNLSEYLHRPGHSLKYSVPIFWGWMLFGVFYFFAGYWKLRYFGADWFTTDHLRYILWQQWIDHRDWVPAFRIDRYPLVCRVSAFLVVLLQLSFLVFLFIRPLRIFAVAGGLIFHLSVWLFIDISFWPLCSCYVMFFDWGGLEEKRPLLAFFRLLKLRRPSWRLALLSPDTRAATFAAVPILLGNIFCGLLDVNTWPCASSPHFAYATPEIDRNLRFRVVSGGEAAVFLASKMYTPMDISIWSTNIRKICVEKDPQKRAHALVGMWNLLPRWRRAGETVEVSRIIRRLDEKYPILTTIQSELILRADLSDGEIVKNSIEYH